MTSSPNLDPEQLLADSRWMRTLALRLLRGDAHAAQDLVQDAWVVALGRDDPPTRAWIAGVMRNLARLGWRTRERREAHERGAQAAREVPTPQELTSQLETQRALAEALLRVREPFREALLLRYREGLEPREIAAHLDLSGSTVRSRLLRGLDLLRDELDDDHGGDGRTWALALLPLARLAEPPPVVAMPLAAKVAGGVLAVSGLTALGLGLRGDHANDTSMIVGPDSSPTAVAEGALASSDSAREPLDSPVTTEEPTPAAARSPLLRGRVLSAEGAPVPDIGVGLLADRWAPLGERPTDVVQTNEAGRFELPAPAAGGVLRVADDDWTTLLDCTAWPQRALPERTLVAAPAQRLRVEVVDERGTPISGALVRHALPPGFRARYPHSLAAVNVATHEGVTDADGVATFARLPRVAQASLDVRATGFVGDSVLVEHASGERLLVELESAPENGTAIRGVVLDGFGRPLASASVAAGESHTRSDGTGHFLLDRLPESGPLTLRAAGPGFAPVRLEVSQDERSSEVVVRLGPAVLAIGGRVVDESGAPVRGALVWPATPTPFGRALEGGPLYAESLALPAEPFPWQEAVTDAEGRFRLDGLLAKDYALGVRVPGRAPVTHLTCSAGELDVTLQLAAAPPPLVLRGTLRAPDGSPVVNATVGFESTLMDLPAVPGARPEFAQRARMRVRHVHTGRTFAIDPQRESLRAIGAVVAVTDPSGSFELPGVPSDGERFLWVTSPDHLPHEVRLDTGAREIDVRVAVRRRLQVLREAEDPAFDSVRVVDASGEELALVEELGDWTTERVRLPVSGERSAWRAVSATAAELVFELDGVEVARCRLQAGPGVTLERSGPLRVTGK